MDAGVLYAVLCHIWLYHNASQLYMGSVKSQYHVISTYTCCTPSADLQHCMSNGAQVISRATCQPWTRLRATGQGGLGTGRGPGWVPLVGQGTQLKPCKWESGLPKWKVQYYYDTQHFNKGNFPLLWFYTCHDSTAVFHVQNVTMIC